MAPSSTINGVCRWDAPALMLTIAQAHSEPTEIDVGQDVRTLTFTANGEYLVTGHEEEVRMWRIKDGTQVVRMEIGLVLSLAASKNGKWIAAGTPSEMSVWDARTYEQVLKEEVGYVYGVDFSPDSTRLVAATDNATAMVWDLATGKQVQTLDHQNYVMAAKYSPRGDRIATVSFESVRVWDSNDGCLLVDIDAEENSYFTNGLLWSNDHLFVVSDINFEEFDRKFEKFDASTGSKDLEWPVRDTNVYWSIALPKHEQFIAFSAKRTVTFWDTTHNQLPLTLQHPEDIRFIAFSPGDRILAIGGGRKITLLPVSTVTCWVMSSLNSFLVLSICTGPIPTVSPTSYLPRTCHSNRGRYTRLVEA